MLNSEEERRLAAFLGILEIDKNKKVEYQTDLKTEAILWLAKKLKETNDELKRFDDK